MSVRVVHGANEGRYPAEGHTVEQVAHSLHEVFNLPTDALVLVNGEEVTRDHVLMDGCQLEFVRTRGFKGGHDYWLEEELREFFGEEEVQQMMTAGMKLAARPVLSAAEVVSWGKWLRDRNHDPSHTLHVRVDIENETITVRGKTFDIAQQMAAVVKCLLDANGERRSTQDMKEAYPKYILDERLDLTIRRKLRPHSSGMGDHIKSDKRGYWLDLSECE